MKKIKLILIIVLFIIPFNYLHSQIKIYYGFKTGLVSAHYNQGSEYGYSFSSDNRIGIDVGTFIESSFNKTLSLSVELNYMQKGEAYDDWKSLVSCMSIPLLLKLKTEAGKFIPFLQMGPRLDVILDYDKTVYDYRRINKDNFGITFGIGCEAKILKNYTLLADIRYDYDFTGYSYRTSVESDLVDVHSRSLAFLVGVKF